MKNKFKIIISIFVLLASGAAVWFFFRSESEEAKIRRNLDELCRICSKSRGENAAVLALKVNKGTEKLFAPVCLLQFRTGWFDGKTNPTKLGADIIRFQHVFESLKFDVSDVKITQEESGRASVLFSGSVKGRGKNGRTFDEVRDIEAVLKQDNEKSWKIVSLVFHEVLER